MQFGPAARPSHCRQRTRVRPAAGDCIHWRHLRGYPPTPRPPAGLRLPPPSAASTRPGWSSFHVKHGARQVLGHPGRARVPAKGRGQGPRHSALGCPQAAPTRAFAPVRWPVPARATQPERRYIHRACPHINSLRGAQTSIRMCCSLCSCAHSTWSVDCPQGLWIASAIDPGQTAGARWVRFTSV